ncbi:hypothetical protein [Uliginosibacterium sp. H1]|uniref:hypothetical protein n=1 Tax=Uliginosibacterium sp. H1 TaxID=3114757 RepID=UPI002E18E020|nr:hypothetical protein [Uliginosibacterium sp. H1]
MSRHQQPCLALSHTKQPTRPAYLLRRALRAVEQAHAQGKRNPRAALTEEEQEVLEGALAKARQQLDIPPHRSVASLPFKHHGVTMRMWFHEDGHLYLMSDLGHRLFSCLDAWA